MTLLLTFGGHWVFLQSVAWVGMVVSYSQNSSVSEALTKTFDGKHPCKLCKVVEQGKKQQEEHDIPLQKFKFEFVIDNSENLLFPPLPIRRAAG